MTEATEGYPPVQNRTAEGEPSVCTWELSVSFLVKEQATTFLARYMSQDIPMLFTYSEEEEEDGTIRHILDVSGVTARGLSLVAMLLDSVDYREPQTPFVVITNEDQE